MTRSRLPLRHRLLPGPLMMWAGLMLIAWLIAPASTQATPAIIEFAYDLQDKTIPAEADDVPLVTVNALERGDISVTLRWQIMNGDASTHRVVLDAYRFDEWMRVPKLDDDETDSVAYNLSDERTLDLQHPGNFGPPTYRLRLVDGDDTLHERTLTIPYDEDLATEPAIREFNVPRSVGADTLDLVPITWAVAGRPPQSNLVFEQVRSDGTAFNAENPREMLWVASSGDGSIRLQPPETGNAVIARLSLVDLLTGDVLDERGAVIAIIGTPPTPEITITPAPTRRPSVAVTGDPLEPSGNFGMINTGQPPTNGIDGDTATDVRYQTFANGFMLWTAATDDIWALSNDGQVFFYPAANYDPLPPNPVTDTPPENQQMPMGDFGRVWGNYVNIRAVLGWATTPSQTYTAELETNAIGMFLSYRLTLPDDTKISVSTSGSWSFNDLAAATPLPPLLEIRTLTATPSPYNPGEAVTISWEVAAATSVTLELYDRADTASIQAENPVQAVDGLPAVGMESFIIPAEMTSGARVLLLAYDGITATNRFNAQRTTIELIPRGFSQTPSPTPDGNTGSVISTGGAYQPFENGFMLWRADTSTIYTVGYEGGLIITPLATYGSLPDNPITDPPPGRVLPVRGFGRVWGNLNPVRDLLGWALRDEEGYTMTIRPAVTANNPGDIALALPTGTFMVIRMDGTWDYE